MGGHRKLFGQLRSVPCQRLMGGVVGVTDDDDIISELYQNDRIFMKVKLFLKILVCSALFCFIFLLLCPCPCGCLWGQAVGWPGGCAHCGR